jgi:hypothetical protein
MLQFSLATYLESYSTKFEENATRKLKFAEIMQPYVFQKHMLLQHSTEISIS